MRITSMLILIPMAWTPAVLAQAISVRVDALARLDLPGGQFTDAVHRGDIPAACRALADYFATRVRPDLPPELYIHAGDARFLQPIYLADQPELVLKNKFAFLAEYVEPGPDIDWNARFSKGEREPTWWINRFLFLGCLIEEFDRTGRHEYPQHGIRLMLDWIRKNPVGRAKDLWASWRGLEIGLRLSSWTAFVSEAAPRRLIEPADLAIILESMREQVEYLATISGPHRINHGFTEQCGIAMTALVFPEFRDARIWLKGVLNTYLQDTRDQFYPDGSQEEMTPHYAYTVVWSLARFVHLMQQRHEPVPEPITTALRRGASYLAAIQKPDGTLPMFNDGDTLDIRHVLKLVADQFGLLDVKYILAAQDQPGGGPPLCRLFPYSGILVMRDSWKPTARCLLMDMGPFGTAHQHEDSLGIDVAAFGRTFIVDPGRYTYAGGPMMDYFQGTRSHATVMVDGASQRRREQPETWRTTRPLTDHFATNDSLALAVGEYTSGYDSLASAGVQHRRLVLLVEHRYWVIVDELTGPGRHEIDQNFQFTPGPLRITGSMAVTGHDDANLALAWAWPGQPQATIRTGQKDPPVGWYSPCYWKLHPAPHLTLAGQLDCPVRLALLLYPFTGHEPPKLAIQIVTGGRGFWPGEPVTFSVTEGSRTTTIMMRDPRGPHRKVRIADRLTTAVAAVLRGEHMIELHLGATSGASSSRAW